MSGPLWLMKLVPVLTIEAADRMVTGGVAATGGEDSEDTRINISNYLSSRNTHFITPQNYW